MKRITILAMLLLAGLNGHAQLSYEAADDYGRLEGITYDLETENKLYAVSLNNHIVVSYDNGETWDLLYAYPNTGARITNLRMLEGNENLCFSIINLYTEEDGIYILNVEDNEIVSTFDPPVMEGLSITNYDIYDSEATTIILNAYTSTGDMVFYTTTSGENWTTIYDATENNNVAVRNVAISPENPAKLFIMRGQGNTDVDGGLLISTDSGETWTEKLAGTPLNPIDFNPTDADDIIVGGDVNYSDDIDENLYRSTDGGNTWAIVPVAWNNAQFDNLLVVKFHPEQDNVIYILETDEIAYSEDGGATWVNTVYPEDIYYAGQNITLNPFDTKEAVITANMYPVRTTDGGETLTQVKAPFCEVRSVSAVKFGATEHLYYGAQGGLLHKNYATNMTDAYNIESPAAFSPSANFVIADPLNEGRLFIFEAAGFMGGNLYVSTDHGATRSTLMGTEGLVSLAVDPDNDNIVYAVLGSWGMDALHKLDITDLENVVVTPITTPGEVSPIGGILAYADHLVLAKNGTVYNSVDDGANWTELYTAGATIAGLSANPLNEEGFGIATSNGVYTTADGGATWTEALEGVDARKMEFSDLDEGIMAVGVYNGINTTDAYIAYYNGIGWVTVTPEEMNYLQSYAMDFNFVGDNINAYVGTVDMGVIRYSFPIEILGTENPAMVQNKVILAPNPASDIVTVHTSQLSSVKNVEVYSITGQKVLESAQPAINISHLSKGVYVVKTETASGAVISGKLVKE